MILFIGIALWILFETTKELFLDVTETKRSIVEIVKKVNGWFWANVLMNVLNWSLVLCVSAVVFFGLHFICPSETSQWEFNINALQDNLVTEGQFYWRGRGSVDGEISYFYLRTLPTGEKIEHIPADKTYIRYSDSEKPHVEVHQSRLDIPDWMYKVFYLEWINTKRTDCYVLVVPEGTITNTGQYEIDMG